MGVSFFKKNVGDYLIPHFLVIFTSMKITNATMMNVISATRKLPTPNCWFNTGTTRVDRLSIPGIANPIRGIIKLETIDCTSCPKYKPKMKATARPITL